MQKELFTLSCKHKNTIEEPIANEKTGEVIKIRVSCKDCGAWIKWARFVDDDNFIIPFGKYKGERLYDVVSNDRGYAEWLSQNSGKNIADRVDRLLCL